MTYYRLPGGTDVAEMALFDIDALPTAYPPKEAGLQELVEQERLVRFPNDSDGGYLLHLAVDEAVPAQIKQYCVEEDKRVGVLSCKNGHIAFGGLESTFRDFPANSAIRANAIIAPGRYHYVAFRTEFPDDLVEQAVRVERNSGERLLYLTPVFIFWFAVVTGIVLTCLGHFLLLIVVAAPSVFAFRKVTSLAAYRAVAERIAEAQLDFPSIVMELRSAESATIGAIRTGGGHGQRMGLQEQI